jgi:hypothetical protein
MARKLTVKGAQYRIEFNFSRTELDVRTHDNRIIGRAARVEDQRFGARWSWRGRFADSADAIARIIANFDIGRVSNADIAFDMAQNAERVRVQREEEAARRAAGQRAREEREARMRVENPMLTVRRHEHDNGSAKVGDADEVLVYGGLSRVSIHTSFDFGSMKPRQSGVNWSAHGTVSPQEAREYALAILRAADEAEAMNVARANAARATEVQS